MSRTSQQFSSARPSAADPHQANSTSMIRWIYLVRGLAAIAWAAAFASTKDSLTTSSAVLLFAYPGIDVLASLIDLRTQREADQRKVLIFGGATSAVAAVGLALAASGDISDVLRVFGVWATVSGLTQIVVAVRRRSAATGGQWSMLVAGALSTLVGIFYNVEASGSSPKLDELVTYATAGGVFFVIQALVLSWRLRKA